MPVSAGPETLTVRVERQMTKRFRPARNDTPVPGAIVIGGDYRGLGAVRALGRQGIPVWVLRDEHTVAATSRFCLRSLRFPDTDEGLQRDYLLDLAVRHHLEGWMLFPTGDESAALLARHHAILSTRYRLTTPPWEEFRWAYDKRLTYRLGTQLGVDQPWTSFPRNREELSELDRRFPLILKPAIKPSSNRFTAAKAWRVANARELGDRYDEACTLIDPELVMIQELIPGGGETQFSFGAVCREGLPLGWTVAQRTRQYPMDFGLASTYVQSVDCPAVESQARAILGALRYTGMVEIEFKQDPRDGRFKLLDVNARMWGWHTLGHKAGLDFVHVLWRVINGDPVATLAVPAGMRWIRMSTDLPTVATELRRGSLGFREYLRSLRNPLEFAILAIDDPVPSLCDAPLLLHLAWQRWTRRLRTRDADHRALQRSHPEGSGAPDRASGQSASRVPAADESRVVHSSSMR